MVINGGEYFMIHKEDILFELEKIVQIKLQDEFTGHDWEHTKRVLNWASKIAETEYNVDMLILKASALLHDVADHKFIPKAQMRVKIISDMLFNVGVNDECAKIIIEVVESISYNNGDNPFKSNRIESKIIQDADRLDSIGAIGIARTFAYGGANKRPIFISDVTQESSIKHFYEKLLLIGAKMNTQAGKNEALKRQRFLEAFLKEFYIEWFGKNVGTDYYNNLNKST